MPEKGYSGTVCQPVTRRNQPLLPLPGSHNNGRNQPFFTLKQHRANWHDQNHTLIGTIRHDSSD